MRPKVEDSQVVGKQIQWHAKHMANDHHVTQAWIDISLAALRVSDRLDLWVKLLLNRLEGLVPL